MVLQVGRVHRFTVTFEIPWARIHLAAEHGEATRDFYLHLRRLGYCESEVRCVLEQGGVHHERDWGRRLPLALRWLLA